MAALRKINEMVVDSNLYDGISSLAEKEGITVEEEVLQILSRVVVLPQKIAAPPAEPESGGKIVEIFQKYFGPKNGVHLVLREKKPHEPMSF